MRLLRLARAAALVLIAAVMLLIGAWCSVATWYGCGAGELMCSLLAGAVAIFTISAVACLGTRRRWPAFAVYSGAVAVFLVWWATISPARDRDWAPNVARTLTATINGDRVVLSNVRNFNWRSETDFDPIWEQRTYYLSRVTAVDLIMSYWMGEAIAHTIISFGFDVAPDLRSR